jgi:hypothetical protein
MRLWDPIRERKFGDEMQLLVVVKLEDDKPVSIEESSEEEEEIKV